MHEERGVCYAIERNELLGRYLTAKRRIKQGEVIFKEEPTLLGPQVFGAVICFKCCSGLKNGYIACLGCKIAPICSPKCVGKFHGKAECDSLAKTSLTTEMLMHFSQIIFPLRCLLLKQSSSSVWDEIMELEAHLERRRDSPIWRQHKIGVERVLLQLKLLNEDDLKSEIVQKVCGIVDVNTFEVRPPELAGKMVGIANPATFCLRGLYLKAALMAHDCTANTHLSIDNNFLLTVTASVDIPEKAVIYINYSNVLQGNVERRNHLREGKYFECKCKRCEDATELGTELSTLICYKCRKGFIRSETATEWRCSNCKFSVRNCLIHLTIEQAKRKLEDVDQSSFQEMELLLRKLSTTFHINHYLNLELKQLLVAAYSQIENMRKKHLIRKLELCKELLDVISHLEPGISRLNSITKYELYVAEVALAHKLFNGREIRQEEFVGRLLTGEGHLKEAIKGLLYEPMNSPEGFLAQKAMSELKMLRISSVNMSCNEKKEEKSGKKGGKRKNRL